MDRGTVFVARELDDESLPVHPGGFPAPRVYKNSKFCGAPVGAAA